MNFRRRPILCTTLYRNPMQASNFGCPFDQLFLWILLWNFHRRCLSTSCILWCKNVKNDQKLKSRGRVLPYHKIWTKQHSTYLFQVHRWTFAELHSSTLLVHDARTNTIDCGDLRIACWDNYRTKVDNQKCGFSFRSKLTLYLWKTRQRQWSLLRVLLWHDRRARLALHLVFDRRTLLQHTIISRTSVHRSNGTQNWSIHLTGIHLQKTKRHF